MPEGIPEQTTTRILLADDHGLFRDSMEVWLKRLDDHHVSIRTVTSLDEVLDALQKASLYHLILLDLNMPGMHGAASVREVCSNTADIPVIIVSAEENPTVIRACIDAGAAGYVPKSSSGETILDAIRQVLAGYCYIPLHVRHSRPVDRFSDRQLELLSLLAEGHSNREIARRIHLSEGTVRQYVSEILRKLNVENRSQAGIKARSMLGMGS